MSIGVAEEKKIFLSVLHWESDAFILVDCRDGSAHRLVPLAHLICNMHTSRNRTISALTACRLSFVQPAAEIIIFLIFFCLNRVETEFVTW